MGGWAFFESSLGLVSSNFRAPEMGGAQAVSP
jgi:hypothetical protein